MCHTFGVRTNRRRVTALSGQEGRPWRQQEDTPLGWDGHEPEEASVISIRSIDVCVYTPRHTTPA